MSGVHFKNDLGHEGEYTGEGVGGVPHGKGVVKFKNGCTYDGDMKNGKCHGQGTLMFADGDRYVGAYENGRKHGQGTYSYANGDRFIGFYENGKKNGQGTLTKADGTVLHSGLWKDGNRVASASPEAPKTETVFVTPIPQHFRPFTFIRMKEI